MPLSSLIELLDDKELTEELNNLKPIVRYDVEQVEEKDDGR